VLVLLGGRGGLLLLLLSTTEEGQDQVEGRLLLDVVVSEGATILELLTSEDEALLIRGNTFLVLDLLLDSLNGVGGFDIQSDCLTREGLDKNLHRHLKLVKKARREKNENRVKETKQVKKGNLMTSNYLINKK